jgi:hypothetical protein
MNSEILLSALQSFMQRHSIELDQLTTEQMVSVMIDWFRLESLDLMDRGPQADALVFRYGGWSEGCATGFKLSLLRRVRQRESVDWFAGITLMFDPARYADFAPFSTISADWQSIDAFMRAIESSQAYKTSRSMTPMGALIEIGGLR